MILLGLDPAIRTTGYGVIEAVDNAPIRLLDCGVIANAAKLPHTECLRRIYGGVAELVAAFGCECAAIESPFVGRNSRTAIILGMARGAILTALAQAGVPAYSYPPSAGKQAAAGSGSARKEQVALMLASELGIDPVDISLDSTDAIALALCHWQRLRHPELGKIGQQL